MSVETASSHGSPPGDEASPGPRKALYILPTLFTVLNLFLGYYAIAKSVRGEVAEAAFLLILSTVLDKLDGMVARKTGTESEFGRELDSLADVVSFGVAPALVAFAWGLDELGRLGWGVTFLFVTCGALRLARFNVQTTIVDRRYFVGLPIPMAAAVPMTLIYAHSLQHPAAPLLARGPLTWMFLVLMATLAFLMVSSVKYFSFKDVGMARSHRLWMVLGIATAFVVIAAWPEIVLPLVAIAYAAHGPVLWAYRLLARGGARPATA